MSRIVSLLASATDTLDALKLIDNLVGRSHECDAPEQIMNLPVCTKPKFETDGSSYEINEKMKAILENSISVYKVDSKLLESLKPSHIITQTQCSVCAVSFNDLQEIIENKLPTNPKIISLKPNTLEDIFNDILSIGSEFNAQAQAQELINNYRQQIRHIQTQIANINSQQSTKPVVALPVVALIEWLDPLMIASNWMPEILDMLNMSYDFAKSGQHSKIIQHQDLIRLNPDYIIMVPCGFDIKRTYNEWPQFAQIKDLNQTKAYQNKRIFIANGNDYFNRPGPRIMPTIEILAEIVYGLDYNHKNKNFINVFE